MASQEIMQEIQILEQNLNNLLLQKQAFQFELNETESALEEVKKTKDDVYKITGQILIKSDKNSIEKELKEKKDIIELRLKSIEKQESLINTKIFSLRQQVSEKVSKNK